MTDTDFMREALKEAVKARDSGNWAIGAIAVLDGKIVARGYNRVHSDRNRLMHAEVNVLNKLQKEYFERHKGISIYTTFEPCPMCFGAILVSGVRRIVAGANFDSSGASAYLEHIPPFFKQPHFKTTFVTGVLAKECAEMWASGRPAQKVIESGHVNISALQRLSNGDIQTYTTPTVLPMD